MSSSIDGGLRALFRKHLKKPDWLLTPIESGGTVSGVPDTHWAHAPSRTSGWVEFKDSPGWAIIFKPHQVGWLTLHGAAGVRCAVAVRGRGAGSGGPGRDSLWLLRGSYAREMDAQGLRCSEWVIMGKWLGPPQSWDWAAVADLLVAG